MRQLQNFLALTPPGQRIVLRCLLLLPLVAVLLRVRGMARTSALLDRPRHRARCGADAPAPQEIARLVDAAASLLRTACLPRSMVLRQILRDHGIASEIRLGVTKLASGNLSAHAWVEMEGTPLNDGADLSKLYVALPGFPNQYRTDRA